LTHFFVNDDLERRRSVVVDFDFFSLDSVPPGETQQEVLLVHSVDDSPSGMPTSVTFFAVRTGRLGGVAAVYVGGREKLEATITAPVGVGAGGPGTSESGMAAILRLSQAD
jgi:hypothetical protein